jgi:pimeloyl-ACP methyl ester carboxylesterase
MRAPVGLAARSVSFPCVLLLAAGILATPGCTARRPNANANPGHYAGIRGIRLYYEIHGDGPPLLLLHGGAGNGMQFEHQLPAFEKRFECIVPDMCAQGRSTDRDEPLTYEAMAEDMVALLDRLHIRSADIMGWSDGGVVGLAMAMRHPDRVHRLVTFGANFTPDGMQAPDVAWAWTATADSFGAGMEEGYRKLSPTPDHYKAAMTKIIALWRDQPRWTKQMLSTIQVPTMVAAGEHDVVRQEHSEAMAQAIPGATLWIVPGASHSVMMEQPDLVNRRVIAFLAGADSL